MALLNCYVLDETYSCASYNYFGWRFNFVIEYEGRIDNYKMCVEKLLTTHKFNKKQNIFLSYDIQSYIKIDQLSKCIFDQGHIHNIRKLCTDIQFAKRCPAFFNYHKFEKFCEYISKKKCRIENELKFKYCFDLNTILQKIETPQLMRDLLKNNYNYKYDFDAIRNINSHNLKLLILKNYCKYKSGDIKQFHTNKISIFLDLIKETECEKIETVVELYEYLGNDDVLQVFGENIKNICRKKLIEISEYLGKELTAKFMSKLFNE